MHFTLWTSASRLSILWIEGSEMAEKTVQGAQVVGRVAQLLRIVGRSPEGGAALPAIVEASGLTRPTVYRLLNSLAAEGLTILLIEHNVGMVMKTCDRIVVLNFGEVIAAGTPEEIVNDPAVVEAYLGGDDATPPGTETEEVR